MEEKQPLKRTFYQYNPVPQVTEETLQYTRKLAQEDHHKYGDNHERQFEQERADQYAEQFTRYKNSKDNLPHNASPSKNSIVKNKTVAGVKTDFIVHNLKGEDRADVAAINAYGLDKRSDVEIAQVLSEAVMASAYQATETSTTEGWKGGATLASALLVNKNKKRHIYAAGSGDSHVYVVSRKDNSSSYQVTPLTRIHQPGVPDEYHRLGGLKVYGSSGQGKVQFMGTIRTGNYAISRSVGHSLQDAQNDGMWATPDMATYALEPGEKGFLIVASDGMDVIPMPLLAQLVTQWETEDNGKNSDISLSEYLAIQTRGRDRLEQDDLSIIAVDLTEFENLVEGHAVQLNLCDGHGDEGRVGDTMLEALPKYTEQALKGEALLSEEKKQHAIEAKPSQEIQAQSKHFEAFIDNKEAFNQFKKDLAKEAENDPRHEFGRPGLFCSTPRSFLNKIEKSDIPSPFYVFGALEAMGRTIEDYLNPGEPVETEVSQKGLSLNESIPLHLSQESVEDFHKESDTLKEQLVKTSVVETKESEKKEKKLEKKSDKSMLIRKRLSTKVNQDLMQSGFWDESIYEGSNSKDGEAAVQNLTQNDTFSLDDENSKELKYILLGGSFAEGQELTEISEEKEEKKEKEEQKQELLRKDQMEKHLEQLRQAHRLNEKNKTVVVKQESDSDDEYEEIQEIIEDEEEGDERKNKKEPGAGVFSSDEESEKDKVDKRENKRENKRESGADVFFSDEESEEDEENKKVEKINALPTFDKPRLPVSRTGTSESVFWHFFFGGPYRTALTVSAILTVAFIITSVLLTVFSGGTLSPFVNLVLGGLHYFNLANPITATSFLPWQIALFDAGLGFLAGIAVTTLSLVIASVINFKTNKYVAVSLPSNSTPRVEGEQSATQDDMSVSYGGGPLCPKKEKKLKRRKSISSFKDLEGLKKDDDLSRLQQPKNGKNG